MEVAKSRRAEDAIARLAGRGLDLVSLWRASSEIVAETVPHYLAPCWFTVDPASLLMTSHFQEGIPVLPAEWAAQEYAVDDVNQLAEVARSPSGISTLHDATNGDPASSTLSGGRAAGSPSPSPSWARPVHQDGRWSVAQSTRVSPEFPVPYTVKGDGKGVGNGGRDHSCPRPDRCR